MMNEDRQTAERVYREYYPRILGYVRSKLSSPQEAEDVCSSAMLKIVRGLPTFDPEKSSLSTWIYTIVRNTLTDHYRSRRSHEELGEDIPYEGDDFEEILQEERLEELAAALEKLPQRERGRHYFTLLQRDIPQGNFRGHRDVLFEYEDHSPQSARRSEKAS